MSEPLGRLIHLSWFCFHHSYWSSPLTNQQSSACCVCVSEPMWECLCIWLHSCVQVCVKECVWNSVCLHSPDAACQCVSMLDVFEGEETNGAESPGTTWGFLKQLSWISHCPIRQERSDSLVPRSVPASLRLNVELLPFFCILCFLHLIIPLRSA